MQDIHSVDGGGIIGDGGGGGGGGGSGERKLRPHHHHHHPTNHALKCPRCDSSNTKFCYYNNYNLSQPRHFCKGCRRYWTKGGVLRNVPVGGGCRKTKRSRPKSSKSSESVAIPVVQLKSSSNSSSENSSLTATTTAAAAAAVATEAVSASSSRSPTGFLNIQEFMNPSQGFDHEILEESANCGFFSGIGNFSSLINSSNDQLSFRFDNLLDPQNQWQQPAEVAGSGAVAELKAQPAAEAPPFLDDDVNVKFSPAPESQPSSTSIFGPSDWQPSSDQGLFDLPNAVDHGYNWSQSNPWTDGDQPSYIP